MARPAASLDLLLPSLFDDYSEEEVEQIETICSWLLDHKNAGEYSPLEAAPHGGLRASWGPSAAVTLSPGLCLRG